MNLENAVPIEMIPSAVVVLDKDLTILAINSFACKALELENTHVISKSFLQFLPEATKLLIKPPQSMKTATFLASEHITKLINGLGKHVEVSIKSATKNEQQLLFISLEAEDKKYKIQQNSLANNAHEVLQCVNEPYWQWDVDENKVHFSAQLMSLLGYETKAKSAPISLWKKHISHKQWRRIFPQIGRHLAGDSKNVDVNFTLNTKRDEALEVNLQGKVLEFKDGKPRRMYGSISNVTESQSLLEQLKKQNEYLNLAEKIGNSGHWRYDVINQTLYCSQEIFCIFGVDENTFEFSLGSILSFVDSEERSSLHQALSEAVLNAHSFYYKTQITQPKGKQVRIETIAKVEVDAQGKVCSFFGVCRDVSKADEAHEKLKLLAMVNHVIKVPIFFIDEKDKVVYQDISTNDDGKNTILFDYINFSLSEYLSLKKQARKEGQIKQSNVSFDKFTSIFDFTITYEADEGIYIWVVENVTEKFRTEQQQLISNRLALLGNTFGSVSHDINNVLGVALGSIEMLELKFKQGSKDISTYIERVKNAIDKGKSVTDRLLAFTKKPTVKVVEFDPIQEIKSNQYLFEQLLVTSIKLDFNFEKIDCHIRFPQGEFINILLNLVLNSQDAIQELGVSGTIKISVILNENNALEVHVIDSGIGIKQENLAKVFDPFYSSKSVNKGNGIGLANVYSTMYKHNGQVLVEGKSHLGGAHFTLVFKCELNKKKFKPIIRNEYNLQVAGKHILILDDEESIAEFVAVYLESEGAICVYVNTKEQLLAAIDKENDFDVFITDMILPDLTGREAVALVKDKCPYIRVYSMSGYIAAEDRKWSYPVLRKPFNSSELSSFLAS